MADWIAVLETSAAILSLITAAIGLLGSMRKRGRPQELAGPSDADTRGTGAAQTSEVSPATPPGAPDERLSFTQISHQGNEERIR
jgi:hypothetical protein